MAAMFASDTQSLHSYASKQTFATNEVEHDVQGNNVTDSERKQFLDSGYCPFHPDIQLKKRGKWTRRWKTVLRECPRCAADFLMRQLTQIQASASLAPSIPVAVVERQSSTLSEASSLYSLSQQGQRKASSLPASLPALLPQRSNSSTLASGENNPSLFSRQAQGLYSSESLQKDDASVVEARSDCVQAPVESASSKPRSQEQDKGSTAAKLWNPFVRSSTSQTAGVQATAQATSQRSMSLRSEEEDTVSVAKSSVVDEILRTTATESRDEGSEAAPSQAMEVIAPSQQSPSQGTGEVASSQQQQCLEQHEALLPEEHDTGSVASKSSSGRKSWTSFSPPTTTESRDEGSEVPYVPTQVSSSSKQSRSPCPVEKDTVSVATRSSSPGKMTSWTPFSRSSTQASRDEGSETPHNSASDVLLQSSLPSKQRSWKKLLVRNRTDSEAPQTQALGAPAPVMGVMAAGTAVASSLKRSFSRTRTRESLRNKMEQPAETDDCSSVKISRDQPTTFREEENSKDVTPDDNDETQNSSEGCISLGEATPESIKCLDPVFEPLVKRTYSQIEVVERTRSGASQTIELSRTQSTTVEEMLETAKGESAANSAEAVAAEQVSNSCRMFDCLVSPGSFNWCARSETEQLLDAVPSADRHTRKCISLDSVC